MALSVLCPCVWKCDRHACDKAVQGTVELVASDLDDVKPYPLWGRRNEPPQGWSYDFCGRLLCPECSNG